MANIKDSAKAYEPKTTKNISELKEVLADMDLQHKIVNEGTKEEFSYDYIMVKDEEYRVPKTVLKQLKAQLEEKDVKMFKVNKTGEGLSTEYTVVVIA